MRAGDLTGPTMVVLSVPVVVAVPVTKMILAAGAVAGPSEAAQMVMMAQQAAARQMVGRGGLAFWVEG